MSEENKQLVRRYSGDFMGVAASGRRISVVGVGMFRVANGRVAEFWVSPDRMSLMQQIGALPMQEVNLGKESR